MIFAVSASNNYLARKPNCLYHCEDHCRQQRHSALAPVALILEFAAIEHVYRSREIEAAITD